MWILSVVEELPPDALADGVWFSLVVETLAGMISLGYFVLLIAMLVHCYRNEPDWSFWFWIMIIAPPIGVLAYVIIRFLPNVNFPLSDKFGRWTRQSELKRLEIAAQQIGNPYQYVLWGDALRDVKLFDQANAAYQQALAKDPNHFQALWGAAQIAFAKRQYAEVRELTARILAKDKEYKFGEVLLAHARALYELGEQDAALESLEQHVRRWRHPESLCLKAEICDKRGDLKAARECLTTVVQDLDASPAAIARKYSHWKKRAKQHLRKLPAS